MQAVHVLVTPLVSQGDTKSAVSAGSKNLYQAVVQQAAEQKLYDGKSYASIVCGVATYISIHPA